MPSQSSEGKGRVFQAEGTVGTLGPSQVLEAGGCRRKGPEEARESEWTPGLGPPRRLPRVSPCFAEA